MGKDGLRDVNNKISFLSWISEGISNGIAVSSIQGAGNHQFLPKTRKGACPSKKKSESIKRNSPRLAKNPNTDCGPNHCRYRK